MVQEDNKAIKNIIKCTGGDINSKDQNMKYNTNKNENMKTHTSHEDPESINKVQNDEEKKNIMQNDPKEQQKIMSITDTQQ